MEDTCPPKASNDPVKAAGDIFDFDQPSRAVLLVRADAWEPSHGHESNNGTTLHIISTHFFPYTQNMGITSLIIVVKQLESLTYTFLVKIRASYID